MNKNSTTDKLKGIQGWVSGAISHKRIVYAIVLCVVLVGIFGLTRMKKDEYPAFEMKQGLVAVVYPGAGTEQLEEQVSPRLEEILFSFKEVIRNSVRTITCDGICYTYVDLNCSQSKKDEVWSKIKLALSAQKALFPPGVLAIVVLDDFSNTSTLLVALSSTDKGYGELQEYADDLCVRLRRLPELASVSVLGSRKDEIAVEVDRELMSSYVIDPTLLMAGCQLGSMALPAGTFSTIYVDAPIHVAPVLQSEKEVSDKALFHADDGNLVRIGDIATVQRRTRKADNFVSYNGSPCLILSVVMRQGNDITAFGKEVNEVLEEFSETAPDSLTLNRITDQPRLVEKSIYSFLRDLLISMAVVIVVMMMLFPIRSALIASSGVPVCTAIAFFLMYLTGMELNTVTLAALIMCLGMIVDDSIITMDGYMAKLGEGWSRREAACRSARELFLPTLVATVAICLMFFPMTKIITGYLGDFVGAFPWVVLFALMVSLFYAVTVVPSLETRFISSPRSDSRGAIARMQKVFFNALEGVYARGLEFCFRRPALTIGTGIVAVLLGVVLFLNCSVQMMPKSARDFFVIEVEMQGGEGLEATREVTARLEQMLLADDRVESVTSFTGTGAPRFTATYTPILPGKNKAQLIVNTRSSAATDALLREYEARYEDIFPQALIHTKQMDYQCVEAPVTVVFGGAPRMGLAPAAERLKEYMASMDNLKWVHGTYDDFRPSVSIRLDEDEASLLGVDKTRLSLALQNSFNGMQIASVWDGGEEIPVNLYSRGIGTGTPLCAVGDQLVSTAVPGVNVPLRQVATVEPAWEPVLLERRAGEDVVSVMADMKCGKEQPVAMKQIKRFVDDEIRPMLPDGATVTYEGLDGVNEGIVPQIVWSFLAAVAVLFGFMLYHFRKLSLAVLTLVTSLLCLFGASLGLTIFHLDLGLTAVLGLVSLVGIIVRNGIILYEYAENLRTGEGHTALDAARLAGKRRMRPIFLTSCTTALGVLPMIISGDLLWQPMGVVICFGIVFSIALLVLIMPVSYWLIFKDRETVV